MLPRLKWFRKKIGRIGIFRERERERGREYKRANSDAHRAKYRLVYPDVGHMGLFSIFATYLQIQNHVKIKKNPQKALCLL
jgi:hypothetical protein